MGSGFELGQTFGQILNLTYNPNVAYQWIHVRSLMAAN